MYCQKQGGISIILYGKIKTKTSFRINGYVINENF